METLGERLEVIVNDNTEPLSVMVRGLISEYLSKLPIGSTTDLYKTILDEIEPPILEALMEKARFNQSRVARILGLSRITLRKKLIKYFGNKYLPSTKLDELA